jgi:hypothetical protein
MFWIIQFLVGGEKLFLVLLPAAGIAEFAAALFSELVMPVISDTR